MTFGLEPCGQFKSPETKYASIFGYFNHALNWLIKNGGNEVKKCLKN